ncbi:MAG: hypothetical protein ACRD4Y_13275 [Candidatus Acidiferrales bacterium]
MEMFDEQIETKITSDGAVTVKLVGDEQTIRDIEFAELMVEFADNEHLWRRNTDYGAKDRALSAEEKLKKMFTEGWTDREMAAKAYGRFRLLLLYLHKVKRQA